jgi:hypothetical protein
MNRVARSLAATLPVAFVIVACHRSEEAGTTTTTEASLVLGRVPAPLGAPPISVNPGTRPVATTGTPPVATTDPPLPPPLPPPARGAGGCIEMDGCSFKSAWPDSNNPLQKQLGCGPVFQYFNGAGQGILGGTGSFCPDTPANRKLLHQKGLTGHHAGYCETCMGVPADKIFVFWDYFMGPSCPSGCRTGFSAPPI